MQATTDYLIQTFWNLVQWGKTDGPTTAEVLSRACDTHVVKKEKTFGTYGNGRTASAKC